MRLNSRRQLRVEGLESRMLLAANIAPISEVNVATAYYESSPPFVVSDGMLDQSGLVEVSQAAKSLGAHTNSAATTVRLTPDSGFGLAEAIAAAGPHGTVVVEAGTYAESSVMITEPVTIVGEEGAVIEFDSDAATTSPRVIDAGFHVMNTRQVQIRGLEIRDNNGGSTAILIEGSERVSIEDNRITDFQYGVLVESADHSTVIDNTISVHVPAVTFGVTVANGFGNRVRGNTVNGATFGIFASGTNGKLLHNTTSENVVVILLGNDP
jgi:parallel beta-helix repeat protein